MSDSFKLEWKDSFLDIEKEPWNSLISPDNPFYQLEFLQAMETSSSIGENTSWKPHPLLLFQNSKLIAAVVLFIRMDSYGEFIFDFEWANLYHKSGIPYYPKFTSAIPFTPITAPKLLYIENPAPQLWDKIFAEILLEGERLGLSTIHFLFHLENERNILQNSQFETRITHQYHWINRNYLDFDSFLQALKKDRRKTIKKERQTLQNESIDIQILEGDKINPGLWEIYWEFYKSTHDKKWGQAYLTKDFFKILFSDLRKTLVLVLVTRDNLPIAGSLNIRGKNVLYGRYWGALEHIDFLHFEVCYYSLIEYSIQNKLERFEAGAQGEHKYMRGFEVVPIHSSHYFYHNQAKEIFGKYLKQEEKNMLQVIDEWNQKSPLKFYREQMSKDESIQ
ncbi:MAG: GNAT family N-acetyltransferase [Leptospira sp.]|nr:GNAT family N-acetyltransferase [Leptospira sp.]